MFLDALPQSASGEVSNHTLPVTDRTNADVDCSFEEPLTFIEKSMCRIWEEILAIDRVDLHDNFFDLGGQSLLGTVVLSRVQSTFQVELPLLSIFESPTIAELAQLIEQHLINQLDPKELPETLRELNGLSDEEVKELLALESTQLTKNKKVSS
jgi:acyl carrier protein